MCYSRHPGLGARERWFGAAAREVVSLCGGQVPRSMDLFLESVFKMTKTPLFDSGALLVACLNHCSKDTREHKGTKVKKIAKNDNFLNTLQKSQEISRNLKKCQEISRNPKKSPEISIYIKKNSRSSASAAATGTSSSTSTS